MGTCTKCQNQKLFDIKSAVPPQLLRGRWRVESTSSFVADTYFRIAAELRHASLAYVLDERQSLGERGKGQPDRQEEWAPVAADNGRGFHFSILQE